MVKPVPPVPIAEQVLCVERELGFRERTYPHHVRLNKLTQGAADYQLHCMRSVLVSLKAIERGGLLPPEGG